MQMNVLNCANFYFVTFSEKSNFVSHFPVNAHSFHNVKSFSFLFLNKFYDLEKKTLKY
jgi:hypothetical protein